MKSKWGVKKAFSFMFLALMVSVLLAACGGGSGGSGGSNPPSSGGGNATITGTVSGTTVKAFNLSGNEVASNTATGNPKTFSLNVPAGGSYKFYLIENEGTANERVYALYQGTTNVFNIGSAVTIGIGFVDTSTGKAVPTNNPLNASGVTSGGEDTTIPLPLAGSAFSLADLQGTWNFHAIQTGDSPQWTGWMYGQFTIDSNGNYTATYQKSDNTSGSLNPATLAITSAGVITDPTNTSLHWVMNINKDLIVGTLSDLSPAGGYLLIVMQKAGGTFSQSDLTGTWNFHSLLSGDSPQWIGWVYGTASINNSGIYTESSVTKSNGGTGTNPPLTFAITADGVITINEFSTFHGVMSQDKNMIVGTYTDGDGGYGLIIFQKSGGTFSQSDLTGTWNFHLLTSGDSPQAQFIGWAYGTGNIDSSGNATGGSITRSNGDSSTGGADILSITSSGVVTGTVDPSFHGVMSQDKSMMVATMNDGGGGYDLFVWMK